MTIVWHKSSSGQPEDSNSSCCSKAAKLMWCKFDKLANKDEELNSNCYTLLVYNVVLAESLTLKLNPFILLTCFIWLPCCPGIWPLGPETIDTKGQHFTAGCYITCLCSPNKWTMQTVKFVWINQRDNSLHIQSKCTLITL